MLFSGEEKDQMFLLTSRYSAMILECQQDADSIDIITKALGSVQVRIIFQINIMANIIELEFIMDLKDI